MADTLAASTPVVETPAGDTPAGDTPACDTQCADRDCGICPEPLESDTPAADTPEQLESLLCGHLFHRYCIHKYAESMNRPLAYLACPMCRRVGVDIDASLGRQPHTYIFDIDDDHDPSAAGSQDPWEAGLWGKGTGKVGTITVRSPATWSDIMSADATAPDDPPTSDLAGVDMTTAVTPASVMPGDELPADVPPSDDTPANVAPPSDMPAGGTPSDGKSKGKGKVRTPTADTPADVTPSDVKGKGKAVTPADGTPADGKGRGKAGKAGRGGKGCKGNAGKAGKVGNDAAEPAAEPVTAPVAAADDTGSSATS